jgi:ParB-like chromosome segregation protein Spo0J
MARAAQISSSPNIAIQIEHGPIERLLPRANNPRTHTAAQVAQVTASIREFGWTNPILVGSDDDVIAGHARLLAARKLGMKEAPVIVLGHLSKAQRRALVIADNQLALNSGWDEELLRIELALLQDAADGLADEDSIPELPETPTTVLGDI